MVFFDKDLQFLDHDSKRSYTNFIRDSTKKKLTLVCGAGVSVSGGLPTWKQYLSRIISIFLLTWQEMEMSIPKYRDVAPKNMSINILDDYFESLFPNFSIPSNFSNEDPLILAQLIKNCIEPANWNYLLRKSLYAEDFTPNFNSDLIESICRLVINHSTFSSILTYNYDDLIENSLLNKSFKTSTIVSENHFNHHRNFPIYHLHGIMPFNGGLASKIYLSEEDYLTDIIQPNSWYNQLHTTKLTSTCCLFLGLSFSDPSLKRKLAIHRLSPDDYHYAFLTHEDSDMEKRKFLLLKNELLRLNVRVIKYPYTQSHDKLKDIISLVDKHMIS